MSESESGGGGAGGREVAYRLFAAEYEDADFSYSESDEERAPNYVVTPTGARANRVFVVGVLTETEQVNDDVLRARIVDPTGAFVVYAGQYQPDELAFLERAQPPTFVAVTGKARTFQPEDSDRVYTSIRPESINEVTAETRDRWTVGTAEQTLARVATMADALSREERGDDLRNALVAEGVDEGLAAGVALAIDHYGTTPTYLNAVRDLALDAARVVADERDEVAELTVSPGDEGATTLTDLLALDTDLGLAGGADTETASATSPAASEPVSTESNDSTTEPEPAVEPEPAAETEPTTETESATEPTTADSEPTQPEPTETADPADTGETEPATESASATEPEPEPETEPTSEPEPAAEPSDEADDEELGDFEPGEFELDEDEREEIEEEYGTEFSTGTEVDEPGEADIETPEPDVETEAERESVSEPAAESDESAEPESEPEPEPEADSGESAEATESAEAESEPEPGEPPEDVDLSDAVMTVMEELNGDGGAPRDDVIARVREEYGADAAEVEDAIQDALMDGRCYEPDDETLKPI